MIGLITSQVDNEPQLIHRLLPSFPLLLHRVDAAAVDRCRGALAHFCWGATPCMAALERFSLSWSPRAYPAILLWILQNGVGQLIELIPQSLELHPDGHTFEEQLFGLFGGSQLQSIDEEIQFLGEILQGQLSVE